MLADGDIRASRLVQPFRPTIPNDYSYWIVTPRAMSFQHFGNGCCSRLRRARQGCRAKCMHARDPFRNDECKVVCAAIVICNRMSAGR
ncbi:hypothetical protein D3C87_1853260 [compost metagenome]